MLEDDGHWLKLMRSAATLRQANICLNFSGSYVTCSVTQSVAQGVELRVTCEIGDPEISDRIGDKKLNPDFLRNSQPVREVAENEEEADDTRNSLITSSPSSNEMLESRLLGTDCEVVGMTSDIDCERTGVSTSKFDNSAQDGRPIENSTPENETADRMVSPPIDPGDNDFQRKSLKEKNQSDRKVYSESSENNPDCSTEEMEEHSDHSAELDASDKQGTSSGSLFKCPYCSYYCYRQCTLAKHLKVHEAHKANEASYQTPQNYCEACNIQFMSSKTYQVHREVYCKSRRVAADPARMFGPSEDLPTIMSHENVLILGSNSLNSSALNGLPPVIQPQAIFAALSTNPLILLPCNIVNGQVLVAQNGVLPTGTPIILPTGSSSVMESSGAVPFRGGQAMNKPSNLGAIVSPVNTKTKMGRNEAKGESEEAKCSKHVADPTTSSRTDDNSVLNLKKSASTNRESDGKRDVRVSGADDGPLDLTMRKRKSSCIEVRHQQQHQRPAIRRRNSLASISPTTPPAHFPSAGSPPSPDQLPYAQRIVMSPPTYSNDATTSSNLGNVIPVTALQVNGVLPGLCPGIGDRSSPAPPVLLSALENGGSQATLIPIGPPPPKVLKHGNNRCEDCNIVFYKYDNYLAHKKHYCAYRRHRLASQGESFSAVPDMSSSDDNNSSGVPVHETPSRKASVSDEKSFKSTSFSRRATDFSGDTIVAVPQMVSHKSQSSVYRCDACGVKFSTADNLNAHQTYYCSRKKETRYSAQQAMRRNSAMLDSQCQTCGEPAVDGHEDICCPEEWKCNYCDIVCPSLKSARRHLLTHSEIRGFCCIICGYRGNTLRGMRTHVYEHLNGNATQIEDILASSVVVDPYWNSQVMRSSSGSDEESCPPKEVISNVEEVSVDSHESAENLESKKSSNRSISNQHSPSEVQSESPRNRCNSSERSQFTPPRNEHHHLKQERSDDSEPEGSPKSSGSRVLNATAFCDVVIKTEDDDDCSERILPEPSETPKLADDQCPSTKSDVGSAEEDVVDDDVDSATATMLDPGRNTAHGRRSQSVARETTTSVIRRVTTQQQAEKVKCEDDEGSVEVQNQKSVIPKKRSRSQAKSNTELKYCKSCDISFHHLSNFIAHKKFYCVSRVIENFAQEAAAVQ